RQIGRLDKPPMIGTNAPPCKSSCTSDRNNPSVKVLIIWWINRLIEPVSIKQLAYMTPRAARRHGAATLNGYRGDMDSALAEGVVETRHEDA
ncbi:MAG: hypothetical protein M3Y22_03365, partial [Pseudomonadota bacterium]|nr:hypothetical protein [Pseudomonadota bacterium]